MSSKTFDTQFDNLLVSVGTTTHISEDFAKGTEIVHVVG